MIYQRREQHRTRFTTWPYTISLRIFRTDQPLIQDDRLVGAEALLRWKHPIRGSVSPNDFIPLAEDTGLILPVGKWVLRQAFAQAAAWYRCSSTQHLCVAINLSARQIKHPDFIDHVLEEVQTSGVNPRLVEFELTEDCSCREHRGYCDQNDGVAESWLSIFAGRFRHRLLFPFVSSQIAAE